MFVEPTVLWGAVAGSAAMACLLILWITVLGHSRRRLASALDQARSDIEALKASAIRQDEAIRARDTEIARAAATTQTLEDRAEALEAARREARSQADRLEASEAALTRELQRLRDEAAAIREQLEASRREAGELRTLNHGLETTLAKEREAAEEKIKLLSGIREDMENRFKQLADETMRRHGEDFSKSHRERLEALLTPFREHVGRFEEELRNVHQGAAKERERLKTEIEQLTRRSEQISAEAVSLTRALKGDKQRQGAWGEMILERILEDSGLERGLHYDVQSQQRDEHGGRWRPDVVVRMPREKWLVIDSKVSLVDYEAATRAETEEERAALIRRHTASLRRHIDQLAEKGYHALDAGTVDYVLMFLPIEGALSEALREEGSLTSYALSKGVGLMSPTTLMVALRTVEHIWAVDRRNRNAEAIADRAGKLYDKVAGFVEEMEKVGQRLGQAQEAHATAMDRLSRGRGNVISQVDKLKSLGARTVKSIDTDFDEDEDDDAADRPALTAEPEPAI